MIPLSLLLLIPSIFAQTAPSVVCIAGQCVQGTLNTTIGAIISVPGRSLQLLPGTYTSTTNPQLLHDVLTSTSATLQASAGFNSTSSSSVTLPLNLQLEAGLSTYSGPRYSGQASFSALPTSPRSNTSTTLSGQSLAIANNVWIAVGSDRTIIWDPVPDVNQLPSSVNTLTLGDMQSSACSPACSSNSICTPSGTCQCSPGFTGSSCESCTSGFFGPSCQACPADCDQCDDGISGSGRCIRPRVANLPSSCSCENGVCGSNGQCACTGGFGSTQGATTQCTTCTVGFFLATTGDCEACQAGCTACSAGTGECALCRNGMTKDNNDPTKCILIPPVDGNNQPCPADSFNSNGACTRCPASCGSCTGGLASDCATCANGFYMMNGACLPANTEGVCQGTNLIADNVKLVCNGCGAKCASCSIPGFGPTSTVQDKQCTTCIPGTFLNNGQCIDECPAGTVVSQDGFTCLPCDSGCATCAGSPSFCLTCTSNLVASAGKCVSSCPSGTTPSSTGGSCLTCHPDCTSCSGPSFTQCTACPSNRPVLSNGRCLPTCSKSQYFDKASGTCQGCESSCASCSGPGGSQCLSCSSPSQVLRGGACVAANCASDANVIPNLGICLSELVVTTTTSTPDPSITNITTPTTALGRRRLQWWQILLMALGCAFIFVVIILLFRRRQRKKRAQKTGLFATGQLQTGGRTSWGWRLMRWGEKLFGHRTTKKVHFADVPDESEYGKHISASEGYGKQKSMKLKILHLGSRDSLAPVGYSNDDRYPTITPTSKHVQVHIPRNDFDTDLERGDEVLRSPPFHSRTQSQSNFYTLPISSTSNTKLVKPNPPFADSPRHSFSHSRNGSTGSLEGVRISKPIPSKELLEEEDMIQLIGSYNRPLSSAPSPPSTVNSFPEPLTSRPPSDEVTTPPTEPTRIRLNPLHTRITPRDNGVGMRPVVTKKPFGWKRQSRSNVPVPNFGAYEPTTTTRPVSAASTNSSASMYSQMTTKLLHDGTSRANASRVPHPPIPNSIPERDERSGGAAQEAKSPFHGWI